METKNFYSHNGSNEKRVLHAVLNGRNFKCAFVLRGFWGNVSQWVNHYTRFIQRVTLKHFIVCSRNNQFVNQFASIV